MTQDSFELVKKLMKIVGGKAIIVEDGKPVFVVANIDDYMQFEGANSNDFVSSESELIEKINKDITVWKSKQKEKEIRQLELEKEFEEKRNRDIEII